MADNSKSELGKFIRTQRTMVLGTAAPAPWCAPVYFVYGERKFYFFSSPRSRHASAALDTGRCAAAVYRDSHSWREIEGLQMDGRLEKVPLSTESYRAFSSYVRKFPTVQEFFVDTVFDFSQFINRFRAQLYAFVPEHVFYLNNTSGLGERQEIELPA